MRRYAPPVGDESIAGRPKADLAPGTERPLFEHASELVTKSQKILA